MPKSFNFLCGAALACAFAMPLAAQDANVDTVVATVGDTEITIGHMLDIKSQLPEQYRNIPDDVMFPGLLDQMIQQEMLAQALETPPAGFEKALENQRRIILSTSAIQDLRGSAVTDEALQAAYAQQFTAGAAGQEFNASHILVEEEAKALELVAMLADGADFAELAKEHSTGPSGPGGGSLGWFGTGRMVPAFEAAVVDLEKGAVSAPVQTQFGWHVIILNDVRDIEPPALESVRAELAATIEGAAVEARIAELTAKFNITRAEVDPTVLSTVTQGN